MYRRVNICNHVGSFALLGWNSGLCIRVIRIVSRQFVQRVSVVLASGQLSGSPLAFFK
jgi:hypothetical protein